MDDVAGHLGISKKTLYEHFQDKRDLVESVLMNEHQGTCHHLDGLDGKSLNAIEEMFEMYKMLRRLYQDYNPSMFYDVKKYYPDLFTKMKVIRRKTMYDSVLANLSKGKTEGLYRADLNIGIIARLQMFLNENLLDSDLFTQEEMTSFEMFHEIFIYHIQGILSPGGRTFFEENFAEFRDSL